MADKLTSMKYSKAEAKEEAKEMSVGYDGQPNEYPWGLCIRLEADELGKLGITDLPKVGTEVSFTAVAKVTSVSQSASEARDEETTVALQITAMQITKG